MQKSIAISELSLEGKWISLAKEWLIQNVPCKKNVYFENVTCLMPVHIKGTGESKVQQLSLAKRALKRLTSKEKGKDPFFIIEGDIVSANESRRKSYGKYDYSWMDAWVEGENLDITQYIVSKKQKHALLERLRKKGFKRVHGLVYQKPLTGK